MAFLMTFAGHGTYSPDGKVTIAPDDAARVNADHTARELEAWARVPNAFVPAYYRFPAEETCGRQPYRDTFVPCTTGAIVTNWSGDVLGAIVSARVYRHNFGGRFVAVRVRGTNGAMYAGRASWDWGSCIRLRKVR